MNFNNHSLPFLFRRSHAPIASCTIQRPGQGIVDHDGGAESSAPRQSHKTSRFFINGNTKWPKWDSVSLKTIFNTCKDTILSHWVIREFVVRSPIIWHLLNRLSWNYQRAIIKNKNNNNWSVLFLFSFRTRLICKLKIIDAEIFFLIIVVFAVKCIRLSDFVA